MDTLNNLNTVSKYPYDNYYTPYQIFLPLEISTIIKFDDPVYTFDEVLRGVRLEKYLVSTGFKDNRGRRGYNPVTMLKVVLFGFMLKGYVSTRELEDLCYNDIRFRWLLRYEDSYPKHMTICNFMNDCLKDNIENIFRDINNYIISKDHVDISHLYIDGTKIEANANKYSWVWKKSCITNRDKLFIKISSFIDELNNYTESFAVSFGKKDIYEIGYLEKILSSLINLLNIKPETFVYGKGTKKSPEQRFYEFLTQSINRLKEYSTNIETCGDERNSFSKTDKDATFMRIKTDYMGNDQLLPAYNVQFGVCDEYIMVLDVNKFASDQSCFIPLMNKYYSFYNSFPEYAIADAGYGSLKNYDFCETNNIKKFIKFPMFERLTKNKKYRDDPYRPANFKINSNGNLVCPANREFIKTGQRRVRGLDYDRFEEFFKCKSCKGCKLKKKCHKSKEDRVININSTLSKYHEEVINNLESIQGALLMMNRSIMSEGNFGVMKQDRFYRRLVRKGMEAVRLEIYMLAIGFNLYKLHNKLHR